MYAMTRRFRPSPYPLPGGERDYEIGSSNPEVLHARVPWVRRSRVTRRYESPALAKGGKERLSAEDVKSAVDYLLSLAGLAPQGNRTKTLSADK